MKIRQCLAWGILTLLMSGGVIVQAGEHDTAVMVAKQEIEYLQRWYASATDLIGSNMPDQVEEGRGIYHRIFTPDVSIQASAAGGVYYEVTGRDEWVKVVTTALSVFDTTQHLLGTQIVELASLPNAEGEGGEATMSSYLQAWHSDPDRVIDIYIGTYYSKVRYTPGVGWQIYEMRLQKVAGEVIDKSV